MATEKKRRFTVITSEKAETTTAPTVDEHISYQTNPMYEKLLNFKNLQDQQKKKFSVDDLFKLC